MSCCCSAAAKIAKGSTKEFHCFVGVSTAINPWKWDMTYPVTYNTYTIFIFCMLHIDIYAYMAGSILLFRCAFPCELGRPL